MTMKEEFMKIQSQDEYLEKRKKFRGLDFSDEEVREHFCKLMYIPKNEMAVSSEGLQIAILKE